MVHKYLVIGLITCALSTANDFGAKKDNLQDHYGLDGSTPTREALKPRQTPIIVAPPSGFRASPYPQPTSLTSLNYWWPYGPNGVNPTVTVTPASSLSATEMEESDTMVDTSTDLGSSSSPTIPPSTTSHTSVLTTPASASTATEEIISDEPSKETEITEPTTSGNDAFSVVALLPLFIILGVLIAATLLGWSYGRCMRQCRRGEERTPGVSDVGGNPYEGGGCDHDTIGPLHSLGVSWVDASRIHSQYNLSSGTYHTIRGDSMDGEPGTPSKSRRGTQNWFRHTLSGRMQTINSPSGEKGLNAPLAYSTHDRHPFDSGPYLSASHTQSPRTLRIIYAPPAPGSESLSPTSTQPTPFLSASRHASLRRKIANKVKEDDNTLATVHPSTEVSSGFGEGQRLDPVDAGDWATFQDNPHERPLCRRYLSSNGDSKSPMWSPDPQLHRNRMDKLRIAAETARCMSPVSDLPASLSRPGDAIHSLLPAAAVLSPPLQPHLFFTRASSDNLECDDASEHVDSRFDYTRASPGQKLNRISDELDFDEDDPFRPRAPLNPTNQRARKGKSRISRHMEFTETLPLSPELRGAAMTRLDEIVKSHWSSRNLADVPQSPTLYGALSSHSGHYSKLEDVPHQTGIEEALCTIPGAVHRRVE